MQLRPYQQEAVDAVYRHLREKDTNPCVVLPTAAGKTPVMATICRDAVDLWDGRVVILAHVRELLEQVAERLRAIAPDIPIGIYSAGLKRKDLGYAVTIAGIQSIYKRACDLGPVDLVVVDEAHLLAPEGEGMYRQFLADARIVNPNVRVIGLTATPYRMNSGMLCSPAPEGILNEVCYEVGVRELIVQGYLCPLRTKAGSSRPDYDALHMRAGEYVAGEVEDLMDTDALVETACAEIVEHAADRNSILVFTSGIKHGRHVVQVLHEHYGVECGFVAGDTPSDERQELLERFRTGGHSGLRFLANVNVLTTGFDAPNVDCVAMLRPTLSPGLYVQMVGRGFRLHPAKKDCLVLDFGGNVLRHGPVDQIQVSQQRSRAGSAPAKECPKCHALIAAGYARCPDCGFTFPPPDKQKHEATATDEGILSDQVSTWDATVSEVSYFVHHKRDDPDGTAPPTMRVEYRCGLTTWYRQWVCFEHPRNSYARQRAVAWWCARSNDPVPASVEEAVDLADDGALAPTRSITIRKKAGDPFERIIDCQLGDKPPRLEDPDNLPEPQALSGRASAPDQIPDDEIPF